MQDDQEQTRPEPKNKAYVDQDAGFNGCVYRGPD